MQLVDEAGTNLGVVALEEAVRLAIERHLDLVEMTDTTDPPVVRLMDYKKFQYTQDKTTRKKVKTKKIELKNVRITMNASPHDLEIRMKQLEEFLAEGHKVRIEMRLKGRQKGHVDIARKKFVEFLTKITSEFRVEQDIKVLGPTLTAIIGKI